MNLWPHQIRGIDDTLSAIAQGQRRICLTSPTGGGKTRIMSGLIEHYLDSGRKVALYTNRKLLIEQTSRVLELAGHNVGVRASGYEDRRELPLQVCSIQTEDARVHKRDKYTAWQLHDADLVLIDECHIQTGEVARKILEKHHEAGAAYVGFTATPIGLSGLYDGLVVAGTSSELRACGALVACLHYGPDEPDLRAFKKLGQGEDLSETENVKAMMTPGIFGRVMEWFEKLNPEHKPTILFAPGVRESLWFAEQFQAAGISAAHIDGQEVWRDGKLERTSRSARESVLEGSREGRIIVLCNRFVLREGIDAPWLAHGIFATVFGSLQSYLQSGGRLLRSHHSLATVSLQDHGGNWHRHGSLNADRTWNLAHTAGMIAGLREDRLRAKQESEPHRCPQCGMITMRGRCPCGWVAMSGRKSRPVIQTDGTLKEMTGDIYRPRRICQRPDAAKIWERMYWRARSRKTVQKMVDGVLQDVVVGWSATFRQAFALFAAENNWGWPARDLPFMPKEPNDTFQLVEEVPFEDLIPKE